MSRRDFSAARSARGWPQTLVNPTIGAHRDRTSTSARCEETSREVTHFRHRASSCRRPPAPGPARIPGRTSGRRTPGTAARGAGGRGRQHGQEREDAPVVQRDQPPHRLDRRPAVGAQEAVVADLLEPGGQDVLEEAAEELHRVQGHLPRPVRPHAAIGEGHLAVVAGDDPMVADGDAEDIRGEVPQRLPAVAGGLRVHHPVARPDRRVDQVSAGPRAVGCRGTCGRRSTEPWTGWGRGQIRMAPG